MTNPAPYRTSPKQIHSGINKDTDTAKGTFVVNLDYPKNILLDYCGPLLRICVAYSSDFVQRNSGDP